FVYMDLFVNELRTGGDEHQPRRHCRIAARNELTKSHQVQAQRQANLPILHLSAQGMGKHDGVYFRAPEQLDGLAVVGQSVSKAEYGVVALLQRRLESVTEQTGTADYHPRALRRLR